MTVAAPISSESHFATDHLRDNLRRRSVRGGAITLFVQGSKFLLKTASTVLLARMLTPNDYGLVAMVSAVIGFAGIFKDMGLSTATIQRDELNHNQVSVLFWLNVVVSLAVTLIVAACGPALAWFYHEPKLTVLTAVMGITFLMGGLSVQHQALLARQMRFVAMGVIEVVSMTISIVVGLVMAKRGWGYWSLAMMAIANEISDIVLSWTLCRWRPTLPRRGSGVKSLVHFGGNVTAASCLSYVSRNADNMLIGWYWGAAPVGMYSKAYQLFMLPLQQITTPVNAVVLPALSRLADEPQRYRNYFMRVTTLVNTLGMPMAVVMAVLAEETIRVSLGRQWMSVVPVFQVLSISAIFQPLTSSTGWLYLSTGRGRTMLRWTLCSTAVFVASFVIGLPHGVIGVAVCYTIARFILTVPAMVVACRGTPVRLIDVAQAVKQPIVAAGVAGVVCWVTRSLLYAAGFGKWQVFLLAGSAAAVATFLTLAIAFRNLEFYRSLYSDLMPKKPGVES